MQINRSQPIRTIRSTAPIAKATAFLVEQGQADDGSFSSQVGPAITALAVTALVETGTPADSPEIAKGIDYLLRFAHNDGGIHPPDSAVANYETAIAIMALAACNKTGTHDERLLKAKAFVKGLQWTEEEGETPSSPAYGGAGYGRKKRPDLSNTSFLIEALRASGSGPDDPAIQRAAFVCVAFAKPGRSGQHPSLSYKKS